MKILVLQGSPRTNGHTATRVAAFVEGAREAAHDVYVVDVAHMEIHGCTACEYCHTKGYHGFLQGWYGVEDCGVFEGAGSAAVSDAALEELRAFGRSL